MQDKETVDDAEEALTCKAETISDRRSSSDSKEVSEKKESSKDGKFAFRRMKQPKKEKADKNSPSRFQGEGVVFKAKLIGVESVPEARGDKMCQEAMQKLKQNVRNAGPHKRKINVCVSLQGIKIKDEKNSNVIYHHPVNVISFISQDIMDARAFGYVFGSSDEPHQFIAIKTEKPAFHVVVAIRDLFQTVLNFKQEEIDNAKEQKTEIIKDAEKEVKSKSVEEDEKNISYEENKAKEENIYFEVLLTEPLKMKEEEKIVETVPVQTVDDMLGLENELKNLQEGIIQMDTSIAAITATNSEEKIPENDPFDTSFVLGPKRDSFSLPMPTPVPLSSGIPTNENLNFANMSINEDKYAVFTAIDSGPSIFEATQIESEGSEHNGTNDEIKEMEDMRKTPPAKPPRCSKTTSPDLSFFADLDPLGKDRPYKDKTEFFQDVKNPPKKVLNDLVDPNKETHVNLLTSSVSFSVDFESTQPPTLPNLTLSSSLPNTFHVNSKLSVPIVQNGNGDNSNNPFENKNLNNKPTPPKVLQSRASEPIFHILASTNGNILTQNTMNSSYLGKSPPSSTILGSTQQLTINTSSSPIPIPPRQTNFTKDRSFTNGSIGSPYSKSPIPYNCESPNHNEYFLQNQSNFDNYSPNGLPFKNGMHTPNQYSNNDNLPTISPPTNNSSRHNSCSNANSQNGVSRPRPRPSLSKGSSVPSSGHSNSSHSLSSDSSSDYEAISRENMQSIANVLLSGNHRLRAQSLCIDTNNEYNMNGDKNIFARKNDPFADDFFFTLPKKVNHLTNTEIPEYV